MIASGMALLSPYSYVPSRRSNRCDKSDRSKKRRLIARVARVAQSGGWSGVCAVAIVLFGAVAPMPAAAGEADSIDVPMRRGQATSFVTESVPDSAWGNIAVAAATVLREIEVLRAELGVDDVPPESELQRDRRPAHVYVKSREVMAKVATVQRRFGVPAVSLGEMPLTEPSADEVLASVTDILDGIRAIKTQMVIETDVDQTAVSGLPTLAGAYKSLADASVMLDGLVGRPLSRSDVFGNTLTIAEELRYIGTNLGVELDTEPPQVVGPKRTIDIAQQMLRAIYKSVSLQARLGMQPSAVPNLTMVRVTPTETHDLAGVLWAEVMQIKWHLGVNVPVAQDQQPSHTDAPVLFAQTLLIIRNLDQLAADAGN